MTQLDIASPIDGVTVEYKMLDSALSMQLLAINTSNRPIKQRNILRYADDMINNRWAFTAEPLKVDTNNAISDGQHRCHAVIKATELSGRPISIPILLVRGLHPDAQDKMDTGSPRSVGDQLARRGVSGYSITAAAVRVLSMYKNKGKAETHAAMLDFYDDNADGIDACVDTVHDVINTSGINTSVLIATKFLLLETVKDDAAIEMFISEMLTGTGLEPGSPILALRNRAQVAKVRREFINNFIQLNMVLRVWSAWRKGDSMKKFPVWGRAPGTGGMAIIKIQP